MMAVLSERGIPLLLAGILVLSACAQVPGLGVPEERDTPAKTDDRRVPEETGTAGSGEGAGTEPRIGREKPAPLPDENLASADGSEKRLQYGGDFLDEPAGDESRVLALVDSVEITASDLFQTFFLNDPLTTMQVLENEILYVLVKKEARRLGVSVDAGQVEAVLKKTVENERARFAAYVDEAMPLEEFVQGQLGMPFDDFIATKRRTVVFNLLLDRCVRYREISCRRVRLGLIVVDSVEEAGTIRDKLTRGASFEVVAKDHSMHPSASTGGILPYLPVDERHPFYTLVKESVKLEKGALSEVEATPYFGKTVYRVVKLYDIVESVPGDYAAVAQAVEESLRLEPIDMPAVKFWQECLMERYDVKVKIP